MKASSTGRRSTTADISRVSSSGRGKLPVCVVRIRSVLRFIAVFPPGRHRTTRFRRTAVIPLDFRGGYRASIRSPGH
jgi:hypothetical protein